MTTPKAQTFNRLGARWYRDPFGEMAYPSVTSIIDVLNKPALVGWAAKETANAAVDRIGDWLPMVLSGHTDDAKKLLKGARFANRAAAIGDAVHSIVEQRALGQTVKVHPDYRNHLRGFDAWCTEFDPTFELVETTVYNRTVGYAGTVDFVAWVGPETDRQLVTVDLKTGRGLYGESLSAQLAAYLWAERYVDADGEEQPMPKCDGAACLHLRADEWSFVPVRADEEVFESFKALRSAWRWKAITSRSVMGKPLAGGSWD